MSDEFDDLNLDIDQPEPAPRSRRPAVSTPLYMLMALVLAGACAYLVWLHGEDRVLIQVLQDHEQQARDQYQELRGPSREVREALTEMADHAASETTLHHDLGNRKQALADLDRAQKLLQLADDLQTCNCPSEAESIRAVQNKLDKLMADLQPTEQELSELVPTQGASGEQADSASAEANLDQAQPEQPNESGENNSPGEPDA